MMVQTLSSVPESDMDDGYAAKVMQLSKSLSHAGRLKEAISWGQKAVNINKQLHGTDISTMLRRFPTWLDITHMPAIIQKHYA